jgi:hypothetical protein
MKLKHLLKLAVVATVLIASSNVGWGQDVIYSTGFESSQSFTAGTVYNNATIKYDGPTGEQWGTYFGTASTTGAISGSQSMQMRWYSGTPSNLGYTFTNFDLQNVVSVDFKSSNTSTINVVASFSIDGGNTYQGAQTFTLTTTPTVYSYSISPTGEYPNVRLKFQIIYTTTPASPSRLYIDDIIVYGQTQGSTNPSITNIIQSPSKIIQYNQTVSVSADVTDSDGTVENVELRWGKTAENLNNTIPMASGGGNTFTTVSSIPAQYNGTTIYYAVFAEDNEGGSALSSTQSYIVSPVVYLETFDVDLGDCSSYSVSGDTKFWVQSAGTALMNGYLSPEPGVEEDWLFLPVQNLDALDLLLSFDSYKNHGTTDENNYLKLYYSTNYPGQGDPTPFTWTELAFTQPEANLVWTPSGTIDLSNISGENVYIGFKYLYSTAYVLWNIDNIKLERKTYTVTFNLVDGTTPTGTNPINTATVDFYGAEKLTNVSGQAAYSWVEVGENVPFTVTKTGFHNFNGTLNVVNKNLTQQVRMLSTKVAVNVSANPDANTAVISWVGSGAESYGIHYYVPNTQNEFYVTASETGKTILVSPSTTYTVRVRSLVNGVWSSYSPAVSFTTLAGTPVIASNVNVTNLTSSSAQVNWTGSGAEAYGISYYDINSTSSYYITTMASPRTISVMPETTYGVRVRSMVGGVWSPYTQEIRFTTPAGPQTLATNVFVDNVTSSTARVNWSGSGAEAYGVYYYDINSSTGYYISTTGSPAYISVLPETTYQVKVRTLVNGMWTSYTQPVQFETPAGTQMLATNVFVNGITPVSANVSWNGSGAEAYGVYYYGGGKQFYRQTTASSLNLINLDPETNYAVRVRTRINGQWSSYTAPVPFSTPSTPKTAPVSFGMDGSKQVIPENLLVYPNPASDHTNLRFVLPESTDVTISAYDIRGVLVKSETLTNQFGNVETRFDLSGLTKGMYVIRINTTGYVESKRLIIQ